MELNVITGDEAESRSSSALWVVVALGKQILAFDWMYRAVHASSESFQIAGHAYVFTVHLQINVMN